MALCGAKWRATVAGMKWMGWPVALLLGPLAAWGQVTVSVGVPDSSYLVYEAVPVVVSVRNITGRTIELRGDATESWLSFLITDAAGRVVPGTGRVPEAGTVLIPPGDTVRRTFNLTPLYELRERGTYRVRAEVTTEAIHAVSAPAKLTLLNGQEIWRQLVGVTRPDGSEEYLHYLLLLKRGERETQLYVSVQNDRAGVVEGMYSLGTVVGVGQPTARVDARGHLHVLHRNGARTYGYHEIGPDASLVAQANYSEIQSRPELVTGADGFVSVQGGEKLPAQRDRILTEEELNPPPPPPPPPRKSRWLFGRREK
jgi:hypothetical protein